MNLTFIPADTDDLEALFTLNKTLIAQYEDLSAINLDEVLAWIRRKLEKKLCEYRVVLKNSEKVGYFRLCAGDGNTLEIDDLYVLTPHQGQGIGTEIVRYCIRESEQLQKPIMLYAFTQNTGAIRLYEKMGFVLKETVSPTRIVLIRSLAQP